MFSDLWFNVHILIQLKLWSILSNKKIHQAATLNQRAASNCRFFNFTLFFCYCCSFWVLRLPVDVSISPLLAMSYWNSSQWNSWDNQWQQQQSPPPPPPSSNPPVSLPSHWRSTSQCWDDQVQYGYRLYRSIQPTAWSRKRNLAGQDPLSVPLSHLTRMDLMKQRFERSVRADLLELFVQNLLLNLCLAPKFWRHSAIKGSISMLRLKAFIASWPLSRAFPIARTNRLSLWHL